MTATPPDRRRRPDLRLVVALALLLAAALGWAAPALVGLGVLAAWPRWVARREAEHRRTAVVEALPEAADLLALAVASGVTVPLAVAAAARWAPDPVGPVLARAVAEHHRGRSLADALDGAADDLGPPARGLVTALVASERYGVPLVDALDRLAREARLDRRRRAEERARRLPVLLLFPLVVCILPAFGLLTVVPLLVGTLPELPGRGP